MVPLRTAPAGAPTRIRAGAHTSAPGGCCPGIAGLGQLVVLVQRTGPLGLHGGAGHGNLAGRRRRAAPGGGPRGSNRTGQISVTPLACRQVSKVARLVPVPGRSDLLEDLLPPLPRLVPPRAVGGGPVGILAGPH